MRVIVGFFAGALALFLMGSFVALDLSWIIERGEDPTFGRVFVLAGGYFGAVLGGRK